jgi:nucleoside phosphorylase
MSTSGNLNGNQIPTPRETEENLHPTVGLITAMPEEFVAMRALLDGPTEHIASGDVSHYVLGTVPSRDDTRRHGTVLTLLAATANNAAANGCVTLMNSFPSVSVVIMVGTAAGVPNPYRPDQHVRLGDVVVASHGVVDYDHVKVTDGATAQRRPFPLPSALLVHCADLLKADELRGHRSWEQWLDRSRCRDLAGYGRPPDNTDVLHDSDGGRLRHPPRNISGHRRGHPKVHYGFIGSANRSLRDPVTRDELATKHRILAVEMESSGIGNSAFLNGRDWFVVRGISDYGDKIRAGSWRKYASLTAAAYVRALLAKCSPLEPRTDRRRVVMDSHY